MNKILEAAEKKQFWRIFLKYFAGKTLEDELSFSYYYHLNVINQIIHFFITIFTLSSVAILFRNLSTITYIIFLIFLMLIYSSLDLLSGISWFILTIIFSYPFIINQENLLPYIIVQISLLLSLVVAHIFLEKSLPAFRPFEAVISTPTLIMVFLTNSMFGVNEKLVNNIKKRSSIWKGTERRKFNFF